MHYDGYGLEPLAVLGPENEDCGADSHFQHLKHFFAGYRSAITGTAGETDDSPHSPDSARDTSWRMGFAQGLKDLNNR